MALSKIDAAGLDIGQIGGRRNLIINGAMQVDQRNSGSAVTGISDTSNYIPDRFQIRVDGSGSGRMTAQQVTDAPANFKNSLKITVTTTDASPTASEGYAIRQSIEGQNMSHLNFGTSDAQTITVSFYVKSSVTGDFSLNLGNGSSTRWYGALYTVNTADTWERKTVTLVGDTTGTWASDNTSGLVVVFGLGGGSSRTTTADAWQTLSGTQTFTTGGTNLFATSSATFQITGVQLEVGSVATPFEHRSFGEEMELCRRYYFRLINAANEVYGQGFNYGAYVRTAIHPQTTEFRTLPSLEYVGPTTFYRKGTNATNNVNTTGNPWEIVASNKNTIFMQSTISDTSEDGVAGSLYLTGSGCHVSFNAEL